MPASSRARSQAGSSPLTRGKLVACGVGRRPPGLIPAHAGKTQLGNMLVLTFRAHPRSRGENGYRPLSSGKYWAHPRSRGENGPPVPEHAQGRGSSPLTRGKPRLVRLTVGGARLIPAHAGKTHRRQSRPFSARAHPRSRGENFSSARVTTLRGGLIPAHAGKTERGQVRGRQAQAHPRSRGENSSTSGEEPTATGSSPLTRGKLLGVHRYGVLFGLIPAHAGKTSNEVIGSPVLRAHPRSRGENSVSGPPACEARGSSPLTRGKRLRRRLQQVRDGLIPAHAGKTVPVP